MNIIDEQLRTAALDALSGTGVPDAATNAALDKLCALGTELWLDTGNLDEAKGLWHKEFTALTTNNTLANQVVQTGIMDDIARSAIGDIRSANPGISDDDLVMELGFVVNCHIALRLVKAFGVKVSVELHPAVSEDMDRTVAYAQRYFSICPEKFIIKIPLTPEGYCAVARVRALGIPVNYTLGFSARQNYLAALISNPSYCNVFLGRLNQVVSEAGWGDGDNVGEKAAMACQVALRELRAAGRTETHLIAASMRSAEQVIDLAGTDVYTMPPKVAKEFTASGMDTNSMTSQIGRDFEVHFTPNANLEKLNTLWTVDDKFRKFADALAARGGTNLVGSDLRAADKEHGTELFYDFSAADFADIRTKGKIPDVHKWLPMGGVALDNIMTQAALQSFTVDQAALDGRLRGLI